LTIRVCLVDDQELLRAGFRMVLDAQPDLDVVAEAGDGMEALARLATTSVDVVLMDVRMPVMDGVEATRRIVATWPSGPRVLILTTFDLDEYVFEALRAGASGFLLKDVRPQSLVDAIRDVASGDAVVDPTVTRRLLDRFVETTKPPPAQDPRLATLTPREAEVLLLLGRGASNAEIARQLFLSEATVKTYVGRLFSKLELRDRVQAVVFAYENSLVHAGEAGP
jgi:DNA-binding NarL/FixJ family response regulator